MNDVGFSKELGCLELLPRPDTAYVCRPSRLHFEHIDHSPWDSFLLLDTTQLPPTGVTRSLGDNCEELMELTDGRYLERSYFDLNPSGFDEDGEETPIADQFRLVVRILSGKLLFVAKCSLWNANAGTYDGRHNNLTTAQIRELIERALKKSAGS